uniref:Uncharacterized protein n=1 Tax=Trichinella nativa TaxID=6335 RepID=A0A0V1JMZ4_9BILA
MLRPLIHLDLSFVQDAFSFSLYGLTSHHCHQWTGH